MGRGPQEYLDGGLALLDEHGPADAGIGISVATMTKAAGVARATVYRHWDSVAALNDDLVLYGVAGAEGWQRRILAQAVDRPIDEVLREVLDPEAPETGLWARTSIGSWPHASAARRQVAAWEQAWLAAFEAWLAAHLAARRLRMRFGGVAQLAITLAAMVEGRLILDRVWSPPDATEWFTGRIGDLVESTARVFADVTEPAPRGVPIDDPPSAAAWSVDALADPAFGSATRSLLERATAAYLEAPFGAANARTPGRLVDTGRLARHLGVTERRLYDVWPSATDCNVDLVTALGDRALASFERVAYEMMDIGFDDGGFRQYSPLTISGFQAYVMTAATPGRAHMLQCTPSLVDPAVREAFFATTRKAEPSGRTIFIALLAMSGTHLQAGISLDLYLAEMRAVVAGMQRLTALHPWLSTTEGMLDETPYRIGGLSCYLALEALTTHDAPPLPPDAQRAAPPLHPA